MEAALTQLVADGFVSATRCGGLTLYNYTRRCIYDGGWNEHTMAARGLILNSAGRVVARPFPKFFNLNERPETRPESLPSETPELADKYDGSLIICFWNPEREAWQCVTRGSWDNQQTRWANEWVVGRTEGLDRAYTYLFELIAPWNRIVLVYDRADMVLLGRVHNETGADTTYAEAARLGESHGFTPLRYEVRPLSELNLSDASVTNAEGFVARYSNGLRVKVKYAEYLRLHKLLTGLSVRAIWEGLSAGNMLPPDGVPDEFLAWWTGHKETLCGAYAEIEGRAKAVFADVQSRALPSRKDIALEFTQHRDICGILFSMLDGKDYAPGIWKQLRPVGNRTFAAAEA